jgi:hypothetical protein
MREDTRAYLVYLLQLWRGEDSARRPGNAVAGWRVSLTDPATRDCRKFASLAEFFTHVEGIVTEASGKDDEESR